MAEPTDPSRGPQNVPVPTPSEPFRLRDIALVAYGPTLVVSIGHGAVLPVTALRARELGADVGTAALVVAMLGVGMLLASLPSGAVVARVGERTALVLAGLLDTVAMVAGALTGSVVGLAAAVAVSGAAYSMFLISRQGFMIEAVPEGFRARARSTMGGAFRIGVFVGPLLGAGVIRWVGVPGVFWTAAALSLAAASMARLMPDLGAESRAQEQAAGHASV